MALGMEDKALFEDLMHGHMGTNYPGNNCHVQQQRPTGPSIHHVCDNIVHERVYSQGDRWRRNLKNCSR